MISRSNAKLIDVLERDAAGIPTGATRARPEFVVMTTPEALAADPDLEQFRHVPAYVDEVWAGDDPADMTQTVYLRFTTQTEYDARVGRHLASKGI